MYDFNSKEEEIYFVYFFDGSVLILEKDKIKSNLLTDFI